jgi:hypothetical protein
MLTAKRRLGNLQIAKLVRRYGGEQIIFGALIKILGCSDKQIGYGFGVGILLSNEVHV